MAFGLQYFAELGFADSRGKHTNRRFVVDATEAEAWLDAADEAARLVTPLGAWLEDVTLHSACEILYFSVTKADVEETITYPDDELGVFNFDQFLVSYAINGKGRNFTIPGRSMVAVNMASDGITVQDDTGGTTITQSLTGDLSDVLVSEVDGSAAVYNKMSVSR